ncbi:MAG TPA: hypothetical protein VLT15_05775 [Acidimicrobiia bacterium]|nr:hypothetical protein [Acidimicrobiia bacterium]
MTIDQILEETGQEIRTAATTMAVPELQLETRRPVALRPRRFALAVASAVFVFIAVGLVAMLVQLDSDGTGVAEQADGDSAQPPVVTSIDTPTPSTVTDAEAVDNVPAPTTTTEAAAPAVTMVWTRIESDVLGGSEWQWIEDIAVGGPGLVAVGADGSGGDDDAAVWYSTDGRTWSRVAHDEAVFGGSGDQYMMAVTAGGPGFVAVGEDIAEDGTGISAVWVSEDGITWSRVSHDEASFGGQEQTNVFMKDVTAFGSGLVAVGMESTGSSIDAAAWISADGVTWERVPPDEAVFGGPQYQIMWAVVPAGPGLVAVGQGGDHFGERPGQPAAVWTSTDGRDWSRVPDQAALLSGYTSEGAHNGDWARIDDVIVGGPGLVAAGRVGRCQDFSCADDSAVWTSADGVTWERSTIEEAVGTSFDQIFGVSTFGDRLVATGAGRAADAQLGPAVVWTSTDGGQTWDRVHSIAAFGKLREGPNAMYASVEFESRLIAVGSWGSDAAIWIATNEE